MKLKTKDICIFAIGIALYVVLGSSIKVPLVGHIQTDLGYVVFGVFCVLYGYVAALIGAAGCAIESLVFNGWFPAGWVVGQLFIGIFCGYVFKLTAVMNNRKFAVALNIIAAILAVFIGVGLIKTGVECWLYSIPVPVKLLKNIIAFVADAPPMILGVILGEQFRKRYTQEICSHH